MSAPMYLMSIRPKFAKQIFEGSKKFELRKHVGVNIRPGSTVVLYVSGNVQKIQGEFKVKRVIVGSPSYVWNEVMKHPSPGVDSDDKPYIEGAKKAMALEVTDVKVYGVQVSLEDIRRIIPGFMPPMSYRVLYDNEPLKVLIIDKVRKTSVKQGF